MIENGLVLVSLVVQSLTLLTLVWGLFKMFANAHEARAHRLAATDAAIKAQQAATQAARRVAVADKKVDQIADDLAVIKDATNGMKDALIEATRETAFAAGQKSEREKNGT